MTPLEALEVFQNDPAVPVALRIKAAQAAAPFRHKKLGEASKKDSARSAGAGASAAVAQGDAESGSRYKTRTGPRSTQH